MPTTFHDTVDVEDTLTAQDMTQQEIDDFVDSIGGGEAVSDWTLLDSATFTAINTLTHTVSVDTTKIVEFYIVGECISCVMPIISGRNYYATTGYYYVGGNYTLRTFIDITINSASQITVRYRLEAKGSLDGYPSYSLYYKYKE